eukprot:6180070-Pleurochrysis_carterae.AAC.3
MEPFQVLRYERGQFYKTHHDQNAASFTPQVCCSLQTAWRAYARHEVRAARGEEHGGACTCSPARMRTRTRRKVHERLDDGSGSQLCLEEGCGQPDAGLHATVLPQEAGARCL